MKVLCRSEFARFLAVFLTLFFGCGEHEHGDDRAAQITEGCKHLDDGVETVVDLSEGDAPETSTHVRFALKLNSNDDGQLDGSVKYSSPGGVHYFLLSKSVPVSIRGPNGEVSSEKVNEIPSACASAEVVYIADLSKGAYTISFDGATDAELKMTIHLSGSNHDHDHDHDH